MFLHMRVLMQGGDRGSSEANVYKYTWEYYCRVVIAGPAKQMYTIAHKSPNVGWCSRVQRNIYNCTWEPQCRVVIAGPAKLLHMGALM